VDYLGGSFSGYLSGYLFGDFRFSIRENGSAIQKVTTAKSTGAKNECAVHLFAGISPFGIGIDP
jgi:hypothetical protein